MKNLKYILIFYSGFKRMLLFFASVFYFSPPHSRGHAFSFPLMLLLFILHSSFLITNCFSQWVQQTLPVNKPITGIEFVDTLNGWACTDQGSDTGYVLYTSNGGTNWLIQLSAFNVNFRDIDMINSLTGYAAAADNNISLYKLFKTTNGGVNWSFTTMVPNMYIGDMQFLNKDSAWESGVSLGPDVRTTTDGGNTWIVRTSGISEATGRVFFLNYQTGFVAAGFNVYKTTSTGQNWMPNGSFTQSVQSIFFLNENTGWVGLANGRIGSTINGGTNWNVQQPFPLNGNNTTDVFFLDYNTGYAGTGWFQKILKTTNAGIDWGYQMVPTGSFRISIINPLISWCADLGISKTTNGGGNITYNSLKQIGNEIPKKFVLYQNYPNPFNPVTTIKVDLPQASNVNLVICDVLGRELYTIANQYLKAGTYTFTWDASEYSSGVYFYRIKTDKYSEARKMILNK